MDTMLPPKPDITGEPRPPQAPELYVWGGVKVAPRLINSKWGRRAIPEPPEGWGPPLEWWRSSIARRMQIIGWFVLFDVVVATVQSGGFDWVSAWWMWLIVIGLPIALVALMNNDRPIAAGAHWLYHKRKWIRIYELDSVGISRELTANDLVLRQGDTELDIRVDNLQENPALWALVYNGIRHSVANGTKIVDDSKLSTRSLLHL
jgi:hypothetical protein